MAKKPKHSSDTAAMMGQIQEQLAVMNEKLDSFMTKSLTELAQALANSKPAPRPQVQAPAPSQPLRPQNDYRPQRQMYSVVCFECGKDSELPFKPNGNRPVYCPECFAKRKNRPAPVIPPQPLAPKPGMEAPNEPKPPIETKLKKSAKKAAKVVKKVVKKAGKKKKK